MKPQYLVKLVWFDFIIKGGLLITSKVKFTISRMREFLDNSLTNKAFFMFLISMNIQFHIESSQRMVFNKYIKMGKLQYCNMEIVLFCQILLNY